MEYISEKQWIAMRIFFRFMTMHNYLHSWSHHVKLYGDEWERNKLHDPDSSYPDEWINTSFDWGETKEGHEFWCNVDIAWRDYYYHATRNM
jgi:hypothetical protein